MFAARSSAGDGTPATRDEQCGPRLAASDDENRIIGSRGLHASDTTLMILEGRRRRDDQRGYGVESGGGVVVGSRRQVSS
jgi:hypothetical protein